MLSALLAYIPTPDNVAWWDWVALFWLVCYSGIGYCV